MTSSVPEAPLTRTATWDASRLISGRPSPRPGTVRAGSHPAPGVAHVDAEVTVGSMGLELDFPEWPINVGVDDGVRHCFAHAELDGVEKGVIGAQAACCVPCGASGSRH